MIRTVNTIYWQGSSIKKKPFRQNCKVGTKTPAITKHPHILLITQRDFNSQGKINVTAHRFYELNLVGV